MRKRIYIMALFSLMFMGLLIVGCGHTRPPLDNALFLGNASGRLDAHLDSAQQHVQAVLPHSTGDDRLHLSVADDALLAGKRDSTDLKTSILIEQQQVSQLSTDLTISRQEIKDERAHWVGYKSRAVLPWLIGAAIAVFVGYELLNHYFAGGSLVAKGVGGLLGLFTKR